MIPPSRGKQLFMYSTVTECLLGAITRGGGKGKPKTKKKTQKVKHQDSQSGEWEKSMCKGPVAGPMVHDDHIFQSVPGRLSCSGLFIISSLFLSPKWPGLEDKLHICSRILACLGRGS